MKSSKHKQLGILLFSFYLKKNSHYPHEPRDRGDI